MTPGEIELASVVSGDTWNGINEITVEVNGSAPTSALSSVVMEFRPKSAPSRLELTLSSDDNTISIDNAASWQFSIPAMTMTLNPGVYSWSMQTTDEEGNTKTYLKGTVEVLKG